MQNNPVVYQVKVNEFVFSFTEEELQRADLLPLPGGTYHLLLDHQSTHAHVVELDLSAKKLRVEMGNYEFAVEIKDHLDQLVEQMGFNVKAGKAIKEIKAPMPGLVLEIAVSDGQEVNQGDKLLILEAMKMENSIMIHTHARIKKIAVAAGQAVEKGQLLVELE